MRNNILTLLCPVHMVNLTIKLTLIVRERSEVRISHRWCAETRLILPWKTAQKHKKSTVCPTYSLHGTELSKRLCRKEKRAFLHLPQAVRIGPLEPVNPIWTPRAQASSHRCVVGGWTCHTTPQGLNEKPVSEQTMPGGSRARQWKQRQPFLDMVQSQENLEHERSSSIRTQLGRNWRQRFWFGTWGRQWALFMGGGVVYRRESSSRKNRSI